MIWERIRSNWNHYKVDRVHLASRIEQAYGLSTDEVERQVAGWQALHTDREPSPFGRWS